MQIEVDEALVVVDVDPLAHAISVPLPARTPLAARRRRATCVTLGVELRGLEPLRTGLQASEVLITRRSKLEAIG